MKDHAMDCKDARLLVEKLVDDEASPAEAREAQAHLAGCASCRSDRELVDAFGRALARSLPEPPQGYFDALPGRILARLDGASAPSGVPFWKRVVSPGALRWQALAAMLVVAVAVGLVAKRERLLAPSETPALVSERPSAAAPLEDEGDRPAEQKMPEASEERSPAPPAAPQSPVPEAQEEPPLARDRRERAQLRQDAAVVAEDAAGGSGGETQEQEEAFAENVLKSTDAPAAPGRASARAVQAAPALARSFATDANDCEGWRRALEDLVPEGEPARDARYRLARCSIDRFRSEGTDALRELAIADGDAFLELEKEGTRADEIRLALDALRE